MSAPWTAVSRLDTRRVVVTADNLGPQINIVAWTAMVFMILAVVTRLSIKYNALGRVWWDDGLVVAAMVVAIGQVAAVSMQVSIGGLGQKITALDDGEVRSFEQGQYASDLLYLMALYFSKVSSIAYIIRITPDIRHRQWGRALGLAVSTWALVAIFGIAFECGLPSPWAIVTAHCMNIKSFWDVIGTLDILTDLGLIVWPTYIIWNLQMTRRRRATVSIAFTCRIVLFPLIVLRLVFIAFALNSSDKTFDYRKEVFVTLAHVNSSILVACIPFLKPFMQGTDSGLLTSDLRVRGPTKSLFANTSGSDNKKSRSNDYRGGNPLKKFSPKNTFDNGSFSLDRLRDDRIHHQVNISHNPRNLDSDSRTSEGSDAMIIKRTEEFNVEHEDIGKVV